ncbi:MAG: hypothetical protein ETSY1_13270 [Candidatus Entotheonella factor]|uniref:MucR family transcriptional regulator n=1 Tax=Entotheonella factor TaxID=1429438 RepID=W4LR91_ENTF1|nr:MucR family transcriptional regulator [Candidatus Entotheonella palauensis]ETW99906.1 MAG: hypothetical protein ETSY1_13270 [Candidatus Entotheonella factor]
MAETLLEMAKALVMAQIEVQYVTPDNLRAALHSTYEALRQLQAIEAEESGARGRGHPAYSSAPDPSDWKKTITKHAIICLECGDSLKQLSRRHLQRHGLDAKAYRRKYGIPRRQPLSARVATARRRQLAKSIRPWEKAPNAKSTPKRTRSSQAK